MLLSEDEQRAGGQTSEGVRKRVEDGPQEVTGGIRAFSTREFMTAERKTRYLVEKGEG